MAPRAASQPIYATRQVIVGWEKLCKLCGASFISKRSDALWCSGKCKLRAHREKQQKPRGKR